MYKYILFDLDGTLTDSKEGVCKSVQHALARLNKYVPPIDELNMFIGPPCLILSGNFPIFHRRK